MQIVLASASPRRKELLKQIGLEFEIHVSNAEENCTGSNPAVVVEELSSIKAKAVYDELEKGEELLVIGADTVVANDGTVLGKPKNAMDAKRMLTELSGKVHEVYTGVTLYYWKPDAGLTVKTFHECTKVEFYPMSEAEIEEYVATGDCLDKAGAYGIQGFCARYIKGIEGDYNNVVGLPVGRLYQEAAGWITRRQ